MLQFAAGAARAEGWDLPQHICPNTPAPTHLPPLPRCCKQAPVCQTLTKEVKLQTCQTAEPANLAPNPVELRQK